MSDNFRELTFRESDFSHEELHPQGPCSFIEYRIIVDYEKDPKKEDSQKKIKKSKKRLL